MKRSLLIALCMAAAAANAQVQIAEGIWEFKSGNAAPFPIGIKRTTADRFGGTYADTPVFNGRFPDYPRDIKSLRIDWLNASPNIPGSHLPFWGTITDDGKAISGSWGLSPSSTGGGWSAKLLTPAATPPPAAAGCTSRSISGQFSFLLTGVVRGEAGSVAVHILGRVTTDGEGSLTGSEDVSVGGVIVARSLTGRYEVSADCAATIQVTDDQGVRSNFRAAIASGGKVLQLLEVDEGAAVSGTAYQQ